MLIRGAVRRNRDEFLEMELRAHFFAGLAAVRLLVTLRNPRAAVHPGGFWDLGDPGSIFVRDVSLTLALASDLWSGRHQILTGDRSVVGVVCIVRRDLPGFQRRRELAEHEPRQSTRRGPEHLSRLSDGRRWRRADRQTGDADRRDRCRRDTRGGGVAGVLAELPEGHRRIGGAHSPSASFRNSTGMSTRSRVASRRPMNVFSHLARMR